MEIMSSLRISIFPLKIQFANYTGKEYGTQNTLRDMEVLDSFLENQQLGATFTVSSFRFQSIGRV